MDDLVARAKEGDKSAEKEIFEFLFSRFAAIVKQRIIECQEAEDVAQEAYMTIIQKYKTLTYTASFEAWAHGVLKMKIGNYLQKKKYRKRVVSTDFSNDRSIDISSPQPDYDLRIRLIDCLKKMMKVGHSRYVRVLIPIYQGFKTEEICRKLKVYQIWSL